MVWIHAARELKRATSPHHRNRAFTLVQLDGSTGLTYSLETTARIMALWLMRHHPGDPVGRTNVA